jgi:phosphohistidine phosphatase SixA
MGQSIGQTVVMRFLTIARHCEAVPGPDDFARTLTDRGRYQASQLRELVLRDDGLAPYGPVTALVSAAARTRETYAIGFAGTKFIHAIETSELIYNGVKDVTAVDVLEQLAAVDPVTESLLLIGHYPFVHELLATLCVEMPAELASDFSVGSAVVLALPENETIGLRHYDVVKVVTTKLDEN